jgi:flagellar protein FlaJ
MKSNKVFNNLLNRSGFRKDDVAETDLASYEKEQKALSEEDKEQKEIFDKIEHKRKQEYGLGRVTQHPLKVLTERPVNTLILTIPIALFILIAGIAFLVTSYGIDIFFNSTLTDDVFLFSLLIIIIPLAILDTKERMRMRNIEIALPNFFRDLAGMNESGMTLPNAVHIVAEGEYGNLTPHVKKLDQEMSWNVPFVEAIYRFGMSLGTPLAERSVDLIAKASKAGGDVSEVLKAAAVDSYEFVTLETERRNNMLIYVIIVIISFMVFLFVIAVLTGTFLDTMAEAGAAAAASGTAGASAFGSAVDMDFYRRLFTHAALIQAFFSGLVAGQMGEGNAMAGLKYSAIMVIIAWVAFRIFI